MKYNMWHILLTIPDLQMDSICPLDVLYIIICIPSHISCILLVSVIGIREEQNNQGDIVVFFPV